MTASSFPQRSANESQIALRRHCIAKTGRLVERWLPPHNDLKRGRYHLDQTQEVVRGWERFWNAGAWRRGAITLRLQRASINWEDLFLLTEYGGIWSSRHQIKKGTPTAAITYCDKNAVDSTVVVCLSASNGIQWLDIRIPFGEKTMATRKKSWGDNPYKADSLLNSIGCHRFNSDLGDEVQD